MSNDDDIKGGHTDPIMSLVLTTSPDLNPRTKMKLSSTIETELSQETTEPAFGTKIIQPIFLPSP